MFDPGAARNGNFINYYSFNPPSERLKFIPKDLLIQVCWENCEARQEYKYEDSGRKVFLLLDVGCNSGELTRNLFNQFSEDPNAKPNSHSLFTMKILGIDIDPVLIERSEECNQNSEKLSFKMADIMSEKDRSTVLESFLKENYSLQFDISFLFSITMWIHLNNGDDGLKNFLLYICQISKCILLEPQTWKNYKSAVRRMKRSKSEPFKHFPSLKWRENVVNEICEFLTESCSMNLIKKFGETGWDRSLLLFKRSK
ncbi:hypothetical protein HELRODRAFT_155848 [Helobdella robusta]|uniref:RNA methyltransferase n=1 Tax=Helobdella robusta TaxID=6412 RepID=T1ELN3_HELRO|nr:hypothetical protein HELRODRAFT_155848 [Helobdella robusta]ESO02601.1 hypothetical protein HELRODRAFT_155848 [Helobdella robusta]